MKLRTISTCGFLIASLVAAQAVVSKERPSERARYVYCKKDNMLYENTAIVCNFGKTEAQGCEGWQHGRIDKKDIKDIQAAYKQCPNGKWLSRIELK